MRLVFFRHGPADSRDPGKWPDDSLRPLTSRGEDRTKRAAAGLAKLLRGSRVIVLTSPLVRARQTAELLVEALGEAKLETAPGLSPGGNPRDVLARVAKVRADDAIVLVGHEPDLGVLAGRLALGAKGELPLRKAGAVSLLLDGAPATGAAELEWLVSPRVLRQLGGRKKAKDA
jgi:phosphohistidine phosphatase